MPLLSLSMIVKNEEKYLRGCLESVQGIADEIIVVDTGSTDNTIKIAEEFGAKIFHFEWINDFSAARNYALSKSTGNWILYLDADERISENSKNELKKIIKRNENFAVNCTVKSIDEIGGTPNLMLYPRLFKNHSELKFTGRVHEQISGSTRKLNYKLVDSNIEIIHLGYNIPKDEFQKKAERNLELLKAEFEQNPTGYNAFQIAQTLIILNKKDESTPYLQKAASDKNLEKTHRAHSYRLLSAISLEKNNLEEALKNINESIKTHANLTLINFMASKIYLRSGRVKEADSFCRKAVEINSKITYGKSKPNFDIIIDEKVLLFYALNFSLENNLTDSFKYYFNELGRILLKSDKRFWQIINLVTLQKDISLDEWEVLIEKIDINNVDFITSIISRSNDDLEKIKILKRINEKLPNYVKSKNVLANLYFNQGKFNEAIFTFEESLKIERNPATYFFLISALVQKQDFGKIKYLIDEAENVSQDFPLILEKVNLLKTKLQAYLS